MGNATQFDVIVVGSGMGGMVAAAALSRTDQKVLLLEKSDVLGGQTHSFSREGFSWDAGLHYIGGFGPDDDFRSLLDWLTDEPIEMASMGAIYDTLHMGDAPPLQLSRPAEAQRLDLKARFPDEGNAIDEWYQAMREGNEAGEVIVRSRAMPAAFGAALKWWKRRSIARWCERTTTDVANEFTDNPELARIFGAQWGDFGGRPGTSSFAMHAMVVGSYLESGGWYPVGGAAAIAKHLLPTIIGAGGEVRAGTEVTSLLMEDGCVVGVTTADGEDISAIAVVSDIGARETVDRLLPDEHDHQTWANEIRSFAPNISHFSLFLGFQGDVEAAGATKANHWLYPTGETDGLWMDAPAGQPPGMYLSFASLKDPAHDPGPRQQYAGELIAWTDWSVVERWAGLAPDQRADDYADFKRTVESTLFDQFQAYFPKLAALTVFRELATPLATAAFTGHMEGAFYGLEATPRRLMSDALRMKTPVKGLYLAGQDACTPGIAGAMWGGLLAAGSVEPKVFMHLKA